MNGCGKVVAIVNQLFVRVLRDANTIGFMTINVNKTHATINNKIESLVSCSLFLI